MYVYMQNESALMDFSRVEQEQGGFVLIKCVIFGILSPSVCNDQKYYRLSL